MLIYSISFNAFCCYRAGKQPQILPEQRGVQVAGVEVTLDASLPALVELTGLLPVHRRGVILHALAAPLCKGWEPQGTGDSVTD